MTSPIVSTPSSAGSPPGIPLHPAPLAIKAAKAVNHSDMASLASSPGAHNPTMMTSKEWIIPPRPKPGRKPATDTPPTKRKAQNRAAQRAFRERRAARVGELEEQLEETREEHTKKEQEWRRKVQRLEQDVERYSGEINSWRVRCETLDRISEYERTEKEAALQELAYLRNGARTKGTEAVPLPPRNLRHQQRKVIELQPAPEQYASYPVEAEATTIGCGNCTSTTTGSCECRELANTIVNTGCGKCTPDTHCQCLEETINNTPAEVPVPPDLKRSHSPSNVYSEKRQRHSDPGTPLEMDFTAEFSSKPPPSIPQYQPLQEPQAAALPVRLSGEGCGFCDEGTYCVCAEAASNLNSGAMGQNQNQNPNQENRLAPLLSEVTPPPSDTDVEVLMKLPSLHPSQMHRPVSTAPPANSCVNGPGTCAQCLSDPKSGLFCRSLAALRTSDPNSTPDGCCGGSAAGGECCKSLPAVAPRNAAPSLSCSDAYKTLSSHKGFDQATDELSSWLGKLNSTKGRGKGMAPMEIEAASVMGVLKMFDRRFGRG